MPLEVFLIGRTELVDQAAIDASNGVWTIDPDAADGELLVEFAGRGCYASWHKPNEQTRDTADYLAHITEVGHWSVLEHATVSFFIRHVSRSLTHELIRHRHLSPSQLSQRFAKLGKGGQDTFVVPPLFEHPLDEDAHQILMDVWDLAGVAYEKLLAIGTARLEAQGVEGTLALKRAREAARCVLPNMTPTALTLTGNHRAWREMLLKRLQPEADQEICRLAQVIYAKLFAMEPALYQDLHIVLTPEGPSLQAIPPSAES